MCHPHVAATLVAHSGWWRPSALQRHCSGNTVTLLRWLLLHFSVEVSSRPPAIGCLQQAHVGYCRSRSKLSHWLALCFFCRFLFRWLFFHSRWNIYIFTYIHMYLYIFTCKHVFSLRQLFLISSVICGRAFAINKFAH